MSLRPVYMVIVDPRESQGRQKFLLAKSRKRFEEQQARKAKPQNGALPGTAKKVKPQAGRIALRGIASGILA